ncbi:MAG: DUF2834 domain-containing protein [Gammaproteobacteria bacterium]|nr:DUF2834 domain-containing protein [Gammaproteobacteria bacterium]
MRRFYLIMAILGAAIPMYFFAQFFFGPQPVTTMDFLPALFANGASGGFAADLFISSFVFWAYMWSRRESGLAMWPFVLVNLCIGLSCALPAYLYVAAGRTTNTVT